MSDTKHFSVAPSLPPLDPKVVASLNSPLSPDLVALVAALDRYTASVAVHTHAVRQNSEILTGLVTMLLTEEDRQDPDDEPMIGASMNSPRRDPLQQALVKNGWDGRRKP